PRRRNREEVDWFELTFWGKTAELAAQHLTKGRQVGITGRLQQERWETQEGEKRSRVVDDDHAASFDARRRETKPRGRRRGRADVPRSQARRRRRQWRRLEFRRRAVLGLAT